MWHQGLAYGMDPGFFFVAGLFKVFGWLLFLGLIFGAIRFFRRARYAGMGGGWGGRGGWNPQRMMGAWGGFGRDEAMETARERLAKSELTPEQFEEIKRGLGGNEARAGNDMAGGNRGDWHDMKREWRDVKRGFSGKDNALETARLRLAKGEISAEEFEMIRRTLEN
jgi:uncharacterized membrane protein